jgi:hypothetical protein
MRPPCCDARADAGWFRSEPVLDAFGSRIPLPSLRDAVVGVCIVLALAQVQAAFQSSLTRRRPTHFGNPVRPAFAAPFGVAPPAFQATRADGSPVGPEVLPREGIALVCFLTDRCGACEFALAHMDELRRSDPSVRLIPVLSSGGRLDPDAARDWCAKHGLLEEALFDETGDWLRSWAGERPGLPYVALVVDGALAWGEVGTGESNSYLALVRSWRAASGGAASSRQSLLTGVVVGTPNGEVRVGDLTGEGLWVVTYGPRRNPGVEQRRAALTACRMPTGEPVRRLEIVTDGLPARREASDPVWSEARVVEARGGVLAQPPAPWQPYTEVLLDGEVVYAETSEAVTRDVVIETVAVARRAAPR